MDDEIPRRTQGRLIGIARRPRPRAPMEQVAFVEVVAGGGLDGDHKGLKFPRRGVTILSREDWQAAIAGLADLAGPVPLPWTMRRANLLVEGLALPQAKGAIIKVGPLLLEVTAETYPCSRMEAAHRGLLRALAPDWRGGVTCKVVEGGRIEAGDRVVIVSSPKPHRPKLPG
jgi:MOSC domain-containing protein YiiM